MSPAFAEELADWGPEALSCRPAPSVSESRAYCRRLATGHYENFPVVSVLLPRELRQPFYDVYAFCRWADDLGDETGNAATALRLLDWWQTQLDSCYAGEVRHPVFIALRQTILDYNLPRQPFADLISAFLQDQTVNEYETFTQLRDYCRRSADPVGRILLGLCRQATDENIAWSDSICTGLQLANFWQDVARDRDIGRIYLPREDRERFGYAAEALDARITNSAFLDLMRFEVDRARSYLREGLPLINRLPGRVRVDIDLFTRGGLRILEKIESIGYRVWETRPKLTKWDGATLVAQAVWRRIVSGRSR
jgi:squalene synthase HpnC